MAVHFSSQSLLQGPQWFCSSSHLLFPSIKDEGIDQLTIRWLKWKLLQTLPGDPRVQFPLGAQWECLRIRKISPFLLLLFWLWDRAGFTLAHSHSHGIPFLPGVGWRAGSGMDVLTLGLGQGWGYTKRKGCSAFFIPSGRSWANSFHTILQKIIIKKGLGVLGGFKTPTSVASLCLGVRRSLSWGVSPHQPGQVSLCGAGGG